MVGFFDQTSPQTTSNTVRLWSFGRPTITKDTGKHKANAFGFYAIVGNSVIDFPERSKKGDVVAFLEMVRTANPSGRILLVLDNFRPHHSTLAAMKAIDLRIDILFLPPYSPDMDPIEFIWKAIKRVVSTAFIDSREVMCSVMQGSFTRMSSSKSHASSWIREFLPAEIQKSING